MLQVEHRRHQRRIGVELLHETAQNLPRRILDPRLHREELRPQQLAVAQKRHLNAGVSSFALCHRDHIGIRL